MTISKSLAAAAVLSAVSASALAGAASDANGINLMRAAAVVISGIMPANPPVGPVISPNRSEHLQALLYGGRSEFWYEKLHNCVYGGYLSNPKTSVIVNFSKLTGHPLTRSLNNGGVEVDLFGVDKRTACESSIYGSPACNSGVALRNLAPAYAEEILNDLEFIRKNGCPSAPAPAP